MENNEDLGRLEKLVEKMIGIHDQLKQEKAELEGLLQAKEQEVAELLEQVQNLQEDRSVMHNRVTGLIDRIGEWEKVLEQEMSGQANDAKGGQAQNLSKESSTLFGVASEQSA